MFNTSNQQSMESTSLILVRIIYELAKKRLELVIENE